MNLLIQKNVDLKKLKFHLNNFIKNDIYKNKKIECCPICNGNNYIKYGSYKGIQRYKCKDCGKTFSNATNSIFSYTKKNIDKWIKFIELMMKKKSLRVCAKKLNISLVTAFYWRHKILHGLKIDSVSDDLCGDVHINKTIMMENFKGCRNIKSTERRNIWIIGAKGDKDSMLVMPLFKDCWDWNIFNKKIYSKIKKESYIVAYNDRYISLKAKEHNKRLVKERIEDNRIRYIMMNLKQWLRTFKGIATKYLEEYLSFFILFNLDKKIDYLHIITYLSFRNGFVKTKEIGLQELKI